MRDSEAEDSYFNAEDDDDQILPVPRAEGFLGLFRRKRQRISAPGPHTSMNKGPQSQAQNQSQTLQRGERQIGISNLSSQQHLRPVSPLSSLLEYEDEDELPLSLPDDLPSDDSSSSSESQPRQIEILPYEGSSSDPEDDLLESLVSVSKSGEGENSMDFGSSEGETEGLLKPHGRKRRAVEEEEDDALEKLAPKNRRLSFSVNSVSELDDFASTPESDKDDDVDSTLAELGIGRKEAASDKLKVRQSMFESGTKTKPVGDTTKSESTAPSAAAGPKKLKLKLSGSKSLLGGGADKPSMPLGADTRERGEG